MTVEQALPAASSAAPAAGAAPARRRPVIREAVIGIAILAVSLAHYVTSPHHIVLHNIFQRLYYIPILLACAWFGVRGGLLVAVLCAAAYAPHIILHWGHSEAYQASQAIELAMFAVIALVAGAVSDRERALRREAEATAAERDRALRDLEGTVETLRRADRLTTLGTLTAGMAHEIRNPLGAIGGAVEILERDYPADHPRREFVDILRREIDRLNVIAGRYLDFAKPRKPELGAVDVNEAVRSATALVEKSAGRASVRIESRLSGSLPAAHADAGQVHQALVNLLLNGSQAMPDGGVLEVETAVVEGDVAITVRDHGVGLPEGPVERIFEPFFTTRPGGTGLGLAMARRIAESHGGRLQARNAQGGGAAFELRLPRAPEA
ncbi:MAG: ATP-binding protein [Acidobacteriota bacterium]|jgi:signal transduction histidine kinase